MRNFFAKNYFLVINYLLAVFAIFALYSSFWTHEKAWLVTSGFLFLVFIPGFLLSRIFKFDYESLATRLFTRLSIGLAFLFLISFLAIIFGWKITFLTSVYFLTNILFLVIAVVIDFIFLKKPEQDFVYSKFFSSDKLIWIIVAALGALVLSSIDQQGNNFKGDPQYHLSLMRKVVENEPMTISSLSYVKTSFEVQYIYPLWHIVMGILAKIINFNIFDVWGLLPISLALTSFLVWFYFFKQLFHQSAQAAFALMAFILFTFNKSIGYTFLRMPVPDTFAQYILLPLVVSLSLKFIFDTKLSFKILILASVSTLFMVAIHFVQYFYFLLMMLLFAILQVFTLFRSNEARVQIKRTLIILSVNLVIALAFAGILELKSNVISDLLKSFANSSYTNNFKLDSFNEFELMGQLAIIASPLLLVFVNLNRRFLFLIGLFLAPFLIFTEPIKSFVASFLSPVFMNRLFYNVVWYHAAWAAILGFLFLVIERITAKSKVAYGLTVAFLSVATILFLYVELNFILVRKWYALVFNSQVSTWVEANYLWLTAISFVIGLTILILQRYRPKLNEFFDWSKLKPGPIFVLFGLMTIFFLAMPEWRRAKNYFVLETKKPLIFKNSRYFTYTAIDIKNVGGEKTIDFIEKEIPPKSIVISNSGYPFLPMLADVHMPLYGSTAEKNFIVLFKNVPIKKKLATIKEYKIEYIIVIQAKNQNQDYFDQYPQYFKKIYNEEAIIYKVEPEAFKAQAK